MSKCRRRQKFRVNDFVNPGDEQEETWHDLQDKSIAECIVPERRLKAITANQAIYFKMVETSTITICSGPAGTGKTYMACGIAAQQLKDKRIERIIITRPLVTCGRSFGFLPGDVDEKISPHMRPLLDAFEDFFSPRELERLLKEKTIEMWPLELMRGASIKHAFIICDEAQNAEYVQLHMLLTRLGEGTRMVLAGDDRQTDLSITSPLLLIASRIQGHPEIAHVRLTREDVCRSAIVQWVDERLSVS